jgi:hypothetical protein
MEHGKRKATDLEGGRGVQASPDKIVPAGDFDEVQEGR